MPRREISQHDNVLPVQNETNVHEKPADDPLNELSGHTDYLDFRPGNNWSCHIKCKLIKSFIFISDLFILNIIGSNNRHPLRFISLTIAKLVARLFIQVKFFVP